MRARTTRGTLVRPACFAHPLCPALRTPTDPQSPLRTHRLRQRGRRLVCRGLRRRLVDASRCARGALDRRARRPSAGPYRSRSRPLAPRVDGLDRLVRHGWHGSGRADGARRRRKRRVVRGASLPGFPSAAALCFRPTDDLPSRPPCLFSPHASRAPTTTLPRSRAPARPTTTARPAACSPSRRRPSTRP